MTAPRRRWSLALRTMLLGVAALSLPGAWAGYQLNWVRERNERRSRDPIAFIKDAAWRAYYPSGKHGAPWQLRLFGEHGVRYVWLDKSTFNDAAYRSVRGLFPEATVEIEEYPTWPDR